MRQSFALLSACTSLALASTDTIQFFFPGGYDGVAPIATVISANPTTTVLDIQCPTGTDASDCGFGPGIEYSIISTTVYQATLSEADEFTMSFRCENDVKATTMDCSVSMGGPSANDPGSTEAHLSGTDLSYITASVVKGAELLSASATGSASATSAVASSGLKTTTSATATAAAGNSAKASSASATASGSGSSPKSTGAAYKYGIEGSALLALAGAVAINAL